MDRIRNAVRGVLFICVTGVLVCTCASFAAAKGHGGWQHEISVYGWLANLDGTVEGPFHNEADFSYEVSDIIEDLEFIFMGGYEGRCDRWSIIADLVYMSVGDSSSVQSVAVNLDIDTVVVNTGVGYDLVQSEKGIFSVVGGIRYMDVEIEEHTAVRGVPIAQRSGSKDMLDGIIGLRGAIFINDKWFLPYYADIGTGGSDLSWQLFGGIGYRFSWGDVRLGYRHLQIDIDDKEVMEDLSMSGPVLGLGFRF